MYIYPEKAVAVWILSCIVEPGNGTVCPWLHAVCYNDDALVVVCAFCE